MSKKSKALSHAPTTLTTKRAKEIVRDAILEIDPEVLDSVSGLAVNEITESVIKHLTEAGVVSPESDDELLEGFEDVKDPNLRQDLLDAMKEQGRDKVIEGMIRAIGNAKED